MDKNKIIEAAAKWVAKGAYDKAIREYQKVLEVDPKEVRVLQKMGELYQKKNDTAQASHYFLKVAETYSSEGFFLKAVALYKQVLKVNPNLIEVNLKLAELHQQLGLMSEAMSHFQVVANHYEKAGDIRRTLEILGRMVELDPDNVSSKIKLAELYAREDMREEASAEFRRVLEYLKENNRPDDCLRVQDRLSTIEPDNLPLAKEVAQGFLARGDAKRALTKLQLCFQADPRDEQTLLMLAESFDALGQPAKSIAVQKELAKVYADGGRADLAGEVWEKIHKLDPQDADAIAHVAPKGKGAASGKAVGQGKDPIHRLLTETDVYLKYGLHDKALEHLQKVFTLDAENLDAHEKAYHLYAGAGHIEEAAEQLLNVLRLCARAEEVARAQPYLNLLLQQSPDHPEVPALMSVLRPGGSVGPAYSAEEDADGVLLEATDDEILIDPELEAEPSSEGDLGLSHASEDPDDEVVTDDAILLPDEELSAPGGSESVPWDVASAAAGLPDEPLGPPPEVPEAAYEPEEVSASAGYEAPLQPEPAASAEEQGDAQAAPVESEAPLAEAEAAPMEGEEEAAADELDEASFFMDQGILEEAREILSTVLIAFPGHRRAAQMMVRLEELEGASGGPSGSFDIAAEVAGELEASGMDEEPMLITEDFQYSVEEVFAEFKKGLERVVKPEDVDTHYDLGIAYREMGLIEDAVSEFAIARQGCTGKKKELDCLTMIALLHQSQGQGAMAVKTFREALSHPHSVGETAKSLQYELGSALESMGDLGKALYHFQKVASLDANYRDVAACVDRLAALTEAEEDPVSARADARPMEEPTSPMTQAGGKSRKVGYV